MCGGIEKSIVKTSRIKPWTVFNLFYLRNIVAEMAKKQIPHGQKVGVSKKVASIQPPTPPKCSKIWGKSA